MIRVEQNQKQMQILSQQMIQSVEILQMNSQELDEHIREMALENPLVDIHQEEPENKNDERLRKLEWLAGLDEQNRTFYRYDREDARDTGFLENVSGRRAESLADVLHLQLLGGHYPPAEMEILDYIIHSLDEKGFFTLPLSHLSDRFGISGEEAQSYLSVIKDLEPYGVGASGPREALLIQIRHKMEEEEAAEDKDGLQDDDESWETEEAIIADYFEMLGRNKLPAIAEAIGVPLDRVILALERIRMLSPYPAQGFDTGEALRYITPDITIVKFEDRFEILLNNYSYPEIHVNPYYLKLMRTSTDKEVKDYLNDKFRQIEQTQAYISRRNSTLLELAQCILDVQRDFFIHGEKEIRPFRMKDAAERLGVHESTISRAVRDKYLQCPWGLYPLSYFFSSSVSQDGIKEQIATRKIKCVLKKLIEEEDTRRPLSDQKLCELLQEKGLPISRRTVAKYREEMGIGSTRERKTFK